MNPCSLTYGVTTLANLIAEGLSDDELVVVGALFTQLGDTLATISTQRALCSAMKSTRSTLRFDEGNGSVIGKA